MRLEYGRNRSHFVLQQRGGVRGGGRRGARGGAEVCKLAGWPSIMPVGQFLANFSLQITFQFCTSNLAKNRAIIATKNFSSPPPSSKPAAAAPADDANDESLTEAEKAMLVGGERVPQTPRNDICGVFAGGKEAPKRRRSSEASRLRGEAARRARARRGGAEAAQGEARATSPAGARARS